MTTTCLSRQGSNLSLSQREFQTISNAAAAPTTPEIPYDNNNNNYDTPQTHASKDSGGLGGLGGTQKKNKKMAGGIEALPRYSDSKTKRIILKEG